MKLLRVLTAIICSGIVCSAFAQDEYPAEVDSAWIASQNGGSTELNDGNNEEAPACIGDGCNGTETATTASTAPEQDTTAKAETITAAKGKKAEDDSDEEDCTPADSLQRLLPWRKNGKLEARIRGLGRNCRTDKNRDSRTVHLRGAPVQLLPLPLRGQRRL